MKTAKPSPKLSPGPIERLARALGGMEHVTETGLPVNIMDMEEGTEVAVFAVDKKKLPQNSGAKDPTVYPEVEEMMGIELAKHGLT